MEPTILEVARKYIRFGLSIIPIRADGSKAPALKAGEVEQYRERFATDAELSAWFAPERAVGLAVVCGKVSGNLAVLDFENVGIWTRWIQTLRDREREEEIKECPIVKTPKGGRHVYCRIQEGWIAGGQLARQDAKTLLIEIRGQGHYVLAPGCPPACHPHNLPYTFESEGWMA